MVAPFIVIRTFAIKEGKLEGFKHFLREFFRIIEAKEPRLLSLNAYLNKRGYRGNFRPRSPGRGFNGGARVPTSACIGELNVDLRSRSSWPRP